MKRLFRTRFVEMYWQTRRRDWGWGSRCIYDTPPPSPLARHNPGPMKILGVDLYVETLTTRRYDPNRVRYRELRLGALFLRLRPVRRSRAGL